MIQMYANPTIRKNAGFVNTVVSRAATGNIVGAAAHILTVEPASHPGWLKSGLREFINSHDNFNGKSLDGLSVNGRANIVAILNRVYNG